MNLCQRALCLAGSLSLWLMPPCTATATPAPTEDILLDPVFSQSPEVSPEVLATIRGRFVSADRVLFFGIEMQTRWENTHQEVHNVQLSLNFDLSRGTGALRPQASLSISAPNGISNSSADANSGERSAEPPGGGIVGGVQLIQIRGEGNQVVNAIDVHLQEASGFHPPSSVSPTGAMPLPTSGQLFLASDGGTVTRIDLGPDRFGYSINAPQRGEIIQSLHASGLTQSTRIQSDRNFIENHLRLQIVQTPASPLPSEDSLRAMELLRGINDMGRR